MDLKLLLSIAAIGLSGIVSAQHASVVFDPERNALNEGLPLPAETKWMVTGPVADRLQLVELQLFDRVDMKRLLYTGRWERSEWSSDHRFLINVDELLNGNSDYTVVLGFYEPVPEDAATAVADALSSAIGAYLDENIEIKRDKTKVLKPTRQMMEEMNLLVTNGMSNYRTRLQLPFAGFSQIIEDKLDKMDATRLSMSKFSIKGSEEEDKGDRKIEFARERIDGLKTLVDSELRSYAARELMILRDRVVMADVPTAKVKNIIALNAGYGAIYNSGGSNDLSIGQAPFLGLSIPLGRRSMTCKVLSNSSISAGIFLQNTENEYGEPVTGPLVGRPLYLAYGYRIFRMIRLNAGGALLQHDSTLSDGSTKSTIYGSPFIGASLEINLWLGLGK